MKEKETRLGEVEEVLSNDLFILGIIKPIDDNGLLSYHDFDRVYRIIQKHARFRWSIVFNELTLKRLIVLKNDSVFHFSEEYRNLILESLEQGMQS